MPRLRIAIVALLVFLPTLFFDWVYYDDFLLTTTYRIYSRLSGLVHAFTKPSWVEVRGAYSFYRPVSTSFYVLGSWISALFAGQAAPWAFHLINLLLHSGNALLVHRTLILLRYSRETALGGALLFAVTPAAVPAVAWIPGQNELLLAAAGLSSLIFLLRFLDAARAPERRKFLALHSAALFVALLSKENAVAIPVAGLVAAIAFLKPGRKGRASGSVARGGVARGGLARGGLARGDAARLGAAWIAVGATWFLIRQSVLGPAPQQLSIVDGLKSLAAGFRFLPFYVGAFFFPVGIPVLPISRDVSPWPGWLATAAVAATLFRYRSWRRGHALFGVTWFVALLFPTFFNSHSDPAHFVLRGDRAYLASFGLLVLGLEGYEALRSKRRAKPAYVRTVVPGLLLALAAMAFVKQWEYRDGMAFYSSAARSSPHLALAATHLGDMHLARKEFEKAWESYQRALELDPLQRRLHNNIGVLHLRQGRFGEAETEFLAETRAHPEDPMPWENLGLLYFLAQKPEAGERALLRALEIDPELVGAWARLAEHYSATNQEAKLERARERLRGIGASPWGASPQ